MPLTYHRGIAIRAYFTMDGMPERELAMELRDSMGRPLQPMSARDLDDAAFNAKFMGNATAMNTMLENRFHRNAQIQHFFAQCAADVIDQLEAGEDWDKWIDDVKSHYSSRAGCPVLASS